MKDKLRLMKLEELLNKEPDEHLQKLMKSNINISKPQMKSWEQIISDESDVDHIRGVLRKKKNVKKKVKRCRCKNE